MKGKPNLLMPILLMVVFVISRWPGLMPPNFSAAYAIAFCAGVFFPGAMAWWAPLLALAASDLIINLYYLFGLGINAFQWYQLTTYAGFAVLIWLGRRFKPKTSFVTLLGAGMLGAILFYFITNTAAWFFNPFHNPEYTKTLGGWIRALTIGTGGYPQTWEFFRNTLMSGGLFTGVFVAAMKLTEAPEPEEEVEEQEEPEEAPA